ncbi:MAG: hemerythrin domain-containing protein [Atribacterota bacterium]|nr:hemerythrin domain-containing protein [Atribacterota bacterium]
MQFRAPLMIEHRLIEKMINIINKIINQAESTHIIDTRTVDVVVDFIKTYADKTHHGKEEDILFKDLSEKKMTDEDDKLMKELIEEHVFGRSIVRELVDSKNQYITGDMTAEKVMLEKLKTLVNFYPAHIKKEDDIFFPASMKYLTNQEQERMLNKFWDFDRTMIHSKYQSVVLELNKAFSND